MPRQKNVKFASEENLQIKLTRKLTKSSRLIKVKLTVPPPRPQNKHTHTKLFLIVK